MTVEMAMFPLGSVLFPGGVAPLRLFEPRYLILHRDVVAAGDPFAIVLIERGFEVGGGDTRFTVGTTASPVATTELGDGSHLVVAVGMGRVRVREWLRDDPYPRALVDVVEEAPWAGGELVGECERRLRTTIALLTELGVDVGDGELVLSSDPVTAVFQMAHLAPLQPIDQQRLLEIDDPEQRSVTLSRFLSEHNDLLRLQLGSG